MCRYQHRESKNTKNQVNMIPLKETSKTPVTDPKEREIYKLSDKEFRIILLNKSSKLQEDRELNKRRKAMCKQNENFNKVIETIKKSNRNLTPEEYHETEFS